jgi:1-acyl-sn-glycerol-3-phosphate acyltransferase
MWYPRPIWYPSKAEFFRTWVFAFIYFMGTGMHTFPVRRGERDGDAISLMEDLLRRGDRVLLFPEGTRSRTGELLPGKPGVGMVIHSARPTVVPCYVEGFDRIIPPGGYFFPRFGQKATYRFGPPLDLSRHWEKPFGKESGQDIVDDVMAAIARLKAEADAERAGEGTA